MLLYANLAMMIYIYNVKPIAGQWYNWLNNYNEMSIMMCSFHLIWFTDYADDHTF